MNEVPTCVNCAYEVRMRKKAERETKDQQGRAWAIIADKEQRIAVLEYIIKDHEKTLDYARAFITAVNKGG